MCKDKAILATLSAIAISLMIGAGVEVFMSYGGIN